MIEHLAGFPGNVLGFAYKGQVTKADYETVLIPAVKQALQVHKSLRLYFLINSDFSGIDASTVWDQVKVGIGYFDDWERAAVVTDISLLEQATRLYQMLLRCPMRIFSVAEAAQARAWITAPN